MADSVEQRVVSMVQQLADAASRGDCATVERLKESVEAQLRDCEAIAQHLLNYDSYVPSKKLAVRFAAKTLLGIDSETEIGLKAAE